MCLALSLIFSDYHVAYGVVVGTNMAETHISVGCKDVAKPAGGCHEPTTQWVVSVYECAQRCREDATCLTLFYRKVSRDRLECALSARVYDCRQDLTTEGAFTYAQLVKILLLKFLHNIDVHQAIYLLTTGPEGYVCVSICRMDIAGQLMFWWQTLARYTCTCMSVLMQSCCVLGYEFGNC